MMMTKNRYENKTINGLKDRVHRHIMAEHIGRPLKPYEHVYHKDGDPKNNDLDNLTLIVRKSINA